MACSRVDELEQRRVQLVESYVAGNPSDMAGVRGSPALDRITRLRLGQHPFCLGLMCERMVDLSCTSCADSAPAAAEIAHQVVVRVNRTRARGRHGMRPGWTWKVEGGSHARELGERGERRPNTKTGMLSGASHPVIATSWNVWLQYSVMGSTFWFLTIRSVAALDSTSPLLPFLHSKR